MEMAKRMTMATTITMMMIMLMIKSVIATNSEKHNSLFHKKIHISPMDGFREILSGEGGKSKARGIQAGGFNLKKCSSGIISNQR